MRGYEISQADMGGDPEDGEPLTAEEAAIAESEWWATFEDVGETEFSWSIEQPWTYVPGDIDTVPF